MLTLLACVYISPHMRCFSLQVSREFSSLFNHSLYELDTTVLPDAIK